MISEQQKLAKLLASYSQSFLLEQAHEEADISGISKIDSLKETDIGFVSAITFDKPLKGMAIFSFDEGLIRQVVKMFLGDILDGEEEDVVMGLTVAEFANIVIGNALVEQAGESGNMSFSTPIPKDEIYLAANDYKNFLSINFATKVGKMKLSISMDRAS